MEVEEDKIPYEIIVEVKEVHGCPVHKVGEKWVLNEKHPLPMNPTPRGRGAEAHEIWPAPICPALLFDIYPKVLAMRYGGTWPWHSRWEKGDCWVASCWDEEARVVVNIKRVLE